MTQQPTTPDKPNQPKELRWTVWPLGEHKACLWCLPAVIGAGSLATWWGTESLASTILAASLMLVTFAPKLVPVTYVIRDAALEIRTLGRRRQVAWRRVHAYRESPRAATLFLPSGRRLRKRQWATIDVPLTASSPDAMPEIRRHLAAARELPAA